MVPLCLQEEKMLAWKVQEFPVIYNKTLKDFWKWDMVQNVWENISKNLAVLKIIFIYFAKMNIFVHAF